MLRRTFRTTLLLAAALTLLVTGLRSTALAQNPVIDEWRSGSAHYDPFGDHLTIERDRVRVRESALDPHRGHIDFGSKRYVDRYFRDRFGDVIHEYGWTWTSHGVPHGQLTRERVRSYPGQGGCVIGGGVSTIDRDTVVYSHSGGRGGVTQRDRDTVVYSQRGGGPRTGGVTERQRDTVVYSQGSGGPNGRGTGNSGNPGNTGGSFGQRLGQQLRSSLFDR
ncbi:MAG: hypothetical protein J5I93_11615 [Pirellulaceae bacterium]|nr:hypothetical protein [Pirellulaceae bacterium]